MPQYTLKIKKLCLGITIFEFPIFPLFLIFIISYVITPASGQYFFWIRGNIKSFMFCEPPQWKSAFYKEVQKNSVFCPEQAPLNGIQELLSKRYTRFFYKEQFYKQCQAEIGKTLSKNQTTPSDWTFSFIICFLHSRYHPKIIKDILKNVQKTS